MGTGFFGVGREGDILLQGDVESYQRQVWSFVDFTSRLVGLGVWHHLYTVVQKNVSVCIDCKSVFLPLL